MSSPSYIPGPEQSIAAFIWALTEERDLDKAELWARLLFSVVEATQIASQLEKVEA